MIDMTLCSTYWDFIIVLCPTVQQALTKKWRLQRLWCHLKDTTYIGNIHLSTYNGSVKTNFLKACVRFFCFIREKLSKNCEFFFISPKMLFLSIHLNFCNFLFLVPCSKILCGIWNWNNYYSMTCNESHKLAVTIF